MAKIFGSLLCHDEERFETFELKPIEKWLLGLSTVNIFVGPNNSGKSRFLRAMCAQNYSKYRPEDQWWNILQHMINALHDDLNMLIARAHPAGIALGNVDPEKLNTYRPLGDFDKSRQEKDPFAGLVSLVKTFAANTRLQLVRRIGGSEESGAFAYLNTQLKERSEKFLAEMKIFEGMRYGDLDRYYVPILRGLRPLEKGKDLFGERTQGDYAFQHSHPSEKLIVFTGQQMKTTLENMLLGDRSQRKSVAQYEQFLSKEFFEGKNVNLIPRNDGDVPVIAVEGEYERRIHDLGDGLQTILIMTFMPFLASKPALFFLEEPESYLHPGMQRRLLEVLAKVPELLRHQYFLTTHSNHMLDLASDSADVSVFLFRPDSANQKFNVIGLGENHRDAVNSLGARPSSVLLTNATIWVEGHTDVLYLRTYIEKFLDETRGPDEQRIKEDTDFSFSMLGGSNLVHWEFSDEPDSRSDGLSAIRLATNSMVVIDGDNSTKGERVQRLLADLGPNFLMLKSKEVENTLPSVAVRAIAEKFLKRAKGTKWNQLGLDSIKESDYQGKSKGLGSYLDKTLECEYFASKSGSIKSSLKGKFCRLAVEWLKTNPDKWTLSGEAKQFAEGAAKFVAEANK